MEPDRCTHEFLATSAQSGMRWVNPLEVPEWDDLVRTHPEATVFHSRGWARVLAETYGYVPQYLVAADGQRLWAALPIFWVRSWLSGSRGVSLPFTDRCSPLLSQAFPLERLFKEAVRSGSAQHFASLEIRGVPADFAPVSGSFYEHELDLAPSESVLFGGCDPAMRRSIRKAEKANLRIRERSDAEGMESYYRLHQLTRKKHGLPPQPFSFFRNIHSCLIRKGYGSIFLAALGEQPVAGAIFLHFNTRAVYKFGASDIRSQELRPNNLLLWNAVMRMKESGSQTLSFGRTSLRQDGLRRFKKSFGAAETLLRYCKYDFKSSTFVTGDTDRSSGLHTMVFRYCPRPIARVIGAALYPHIG